MADRPATYRELLKVLKTALGDPDRAVHCRVAHGVMSLTVGRFLRPHTPRAMRDAGLTADNPDDALDWEGMCGAGRGVGLAVEVVETPPTESEFSWGLRRYVFTGPVPPGTAPCDRQAAVRKALELFWGKPSHAQFRRHLGAVYLTWTGVERDDTRAGAALDYLDDVLAVGRDAVRLAWRVVEHYDHPLTCIEDDTTTVAAVLRWRRTAASAIPVGDRRTVKGRHPNSTLAVELVARIPAFEDV